VIHPVPPPSLPSVPILKLNCFVQGDEPSHVFSVEIASNKLVSALRHAIKDKNPSSFQDVDARSLRVSIPIDDGLKENVSNVHVLSPVDQLSDVFSNVLIQKHVHIVVVRDPSNIKPNYNLHIPPPPRTLYLTIVFNDSPKAIVIGEPVNIEWEPTCITLNDLLIFNATEEWTWTIRAITNHDTIRNTVTYLVYCEETRVCMEMEISRDWSYEIQKKMPAPITHRFASKL
jgi:hypothetical protein